MFETGSRSKPTSDRPLKMISRLSSEFKSMWSDLIGSPGTIDALVDSGNNDGVLASNGKKKGAISFSSGQNLQTKVKKPFF